jgi:hypothetical protein
MNFAAASTLTWYAMPTARERPSEMNIFAKLFDLSFSVADLQAFKIAIGTFAPRSFAAIVVASIGSGWFPSLAK